MKFQRLDLPTRWETNMNGQMIVQFFVRKRKIVLMTLLVYAAML
jgi:hypothetical protein